MNTGIHRFVGWSLAIATATGNSVAASPVELAGDLSTADTRIKVEARSDRIVLSALSARSGRGKWSSAALGSTRLVSFATVEGRKVALHWRLRAKKVSEAGRMLRFTFECESPMLKAVSEWQAAKDLGPVEHTVSIVNESAETVVLPLQHSLCWGFERSAGHDLQSWWIEKAAGRPSSTGVHTTPIGPSFSQTVLSEPYVDDVRAYSEDGRHRGAIPWVSVCDRTASTGWYAGVEFSGRVSLELKSIGRNAIAAELGLAAEPEGSPEFRTIVRPGETYRLPTVFVGCFRGNVEDGCNRMKRWIDSALRPTATDPRYPLLTLNSWGSDMGIDARLAHDMMGEAARLGIEMFHIDAGWFRGVGDWRPNLVKFPAGIASVADEAHSLGLKFGLWVAWTQGGTDPDAEDRQAVLNVRAPDRARWFARDCAPDWKPADFVGADLCLSDPQACRWCLDLLTRVVKEYRVDMLEHDQRMIVADCVRKDHPHSDSHGDIAYRATLGYYGVYDALRRKYPRLMFEDCVNGGRMVDFGAARRVHYFSIVDSYDPLSNRRAMYDLTYVMPPAMCECYVMAMPLRNIGEFRNMLRSGLMGWCTVMQDPTRWTSEQKAAAKLEFDLYKTRLRPLIRNGSAYHVSRRPDGVHWDGFEYASRDRREGVLYAFRGTSNEKEHTYVLQGLAPRRLYRLHFQDGGQDDRLVLGSALMAEGVEVKLADPGTSQLVLFSGAKGVRGDP